ncbi:MAG: response regulator [Acidobacteriota bacterium]
MARKKILLVDDAETVLMMERMILGGDYDLIIAKDGQEAVEKAGVESPDLILLDIVMPVMNGIEACRKIRSNPPTSTIPVIMVTTRGNEDNVKASFESGCNEYVTKPINKVELLGKIKKLIGE